MVVVVSSGLIVPSVIVFVVVVPMSETVPNVGVELSVLSEMDVEDDEDSGMVIVVDWSVGTVSVSLSVVSMDETVGSVFVGVTVLLARVLSAVSVSSVFGVTGVELTVKVLLATVSVEDIVSVTTEVL